ncbi:PREDICTED: LOW QUALITY PROTEIN: 3-oxoacyl-[acyl-carrier-protein] reductase FabG-like [Trachymyrmex septentrionalis]|uniref:LOW QUALITY PROTEIN: 3-oxoacyl-[acyl-carrier-protein] reductase FabG-like n=1 Tax=Trachymyrmex septentrionalis TaxID=34720 RepID=UPI00084F6E56|nr:PREDICTED: LOW QUALITY PROTEIN: 3-oxoacyl-[acyl-carrier-protein] reductase FabG-like [Trachymyrmex septentrionalis]
MSFAGKVVLITGASSGIGAETAIHFAQLGASLSITGRNKQNLEKVAEQCGKSKPFIVTGDLANENDVKNIIDSTIKHYGKLDVLVNNAGIVRFGNIEIPLEHYDNIMNVNVRSVFQLTALAVPYLIKTKGNIVNVSSVAGLRPLKNSLPYCMSKAALDQFTRCVALELHHDRCMSFARKVVLITGASSGIGAETAIHFAQLGASLSITGRNKQNLEKVAEQCGKSKPFIVTGDLANENDVKNIIDSTIKHYGKLDVLINNAGTWEAGGIETTSLEKYDNIMNINVRSVFQLTALAVAHLVKTKGNIVNVSSLTGLRPGVGFLAYYMSKAALDQFTRCVALELASRQVRVNAVNPGLIETNIFRNSGMNQEQLKNFFKKLQKIHALGRNGDTSEVAKVIIFLASDDASFITGVTLPVDGGAHALSPVSIQSD